MSLKALYENGPGEVKGWFDPILTVSGWFDDELTEAAAGGPTNYTLTCEAGGYSYAGQAATLTLARNLALDAGSYSYTGQAATLTLARNLALDAGSYSYTGQDATLTYEPGGEEATIQYVGFLANTNRLGAR